MASEIASRIKATLFRRRSRRNSTPLPSANSFEDVESPPPSQNLLTRSWSRLGTLQTSSLGQPGNEGKDSEDTDSRADHGADEDRQDNEGPRHKASQQDDGDAFILPTEAKDVADAAHEEKEEDKGANAVATAENAEDQEPELLVQRSQQGGTRQQGRNQRLKQHLKSPQSLQKPQNSGLGSLGALTNDPPDSSSIDPIQPPPLPSPLSSLPPPPLRTATATPLSRLNIIEEDESSTSPSSIATAHADPHNGSLSFAPLPAANRASPPPLPASPSARSAAFVSAPSSRPPAEQRKQSITSNRDFRILESLLQSERPSIDTNRGDDDIDPVAVAAGPLFSQQPFPPIPDDNMTVPRKIWVKRPGASATQITITDQDLVDDVRDMILRKYANSLGKTFDSPDLIIRINEHVLAPEEPMADTIDTHFPKGQTVKDALIVEAPTRRTPKASPRPNHPNTTVAYYYPEDGRPSEAGEGYFPPVPGVTSPHLPMAVPTAANGSIQHSIAVIGSGHLPPIPSPGGTRPRQYPRGERPKLGRTHTTSPNLHNGAPTSMSAGAVSTHGVPHYRPRHSHSRTHSSSSEHQGISATAAPIPKSPGPEPSPVRMDSPPLRLSSPRMSSARPKKSKKNQEYQSLSPNMLNSTVPPISVLIVEDNPINLKLLEAFVKKLKVRWQTATDGRDAVNKWRTGGFHLVLMDIQLPRMNGLEATREIRRLERLNSIGVFSSTPGSVPEATPSEELTEQDRLPSKELFKSPVIIVALTASSLQSDRHDALAAGCNDFLTKPVNFVWLERKVMEWGCMQALIDFDGWRKWKDYSEKAEEMEANKRALAQAAKSKSKKNRPSPSS